MGKLLCTFCLEPQLDTTIGNITDKYEIVFGKIFVLEAEDKQMLITYNIDQFNTSNSLLENTISVHRKKESNTIYTINSLNSLIKSLNNGMLDTGYQINWSDYSNSILLTNNDGFRKLGTKIFKILYV